MCPCYVYFLLFYFLLFTVYFLLSTFYCLLFTVYFLQFYCFLTEEILGRWKDRAPLIHIAVEFVSDSMGAREALQVNYSLRRGRPDWNEMKMVIRVETHHTRCGRGWSEGGRGKSAPYPRPDLGRGGWPHAPFLVPENNIPVLLIGNILPFSL